MNKYDGYKEYADYEKDGLKFINPMTAKEIMPKHRKDILSSEEYIIEEKFDGTRATLHFTEKGVRLFSRRVSKKTGWLCENSDSVPHLRDMPFDKGLIGTILDGEMFIPNRPFKDVSSTLNCLPEKAIERQEELGKIVFHAFDCLYFRGENVEKDGLFYRKEHLEEVCDEVNSPYIKEVNFFYCSDGIWGADIFTFTGIKVDDRIYSSEEFYEILVRNGREGIIVKEAFSLYEEGKRTRAYQKIKAKMTRDLAIIKVNSPTREYKGKYPTFDEWEFWELDGKKYHSSSLKRVEDLERAEPISKYYFYEWMGTLIVGVPISDYTYLANYPKVEVEEVNGIKFAVLGEVSGFDEEIRKHFTLLNDSSKLFGNVVEIESNGIFEDTGKMRHPRFNRVREDRGMDSLSFSDYMKL